MTAAVHTELHTEAPVHVVPLGGYSVLWVG